MRSGVGHLTALVAALAVVAVTGCTGAGSADVPDAPLTLVVDVERPRAAAGRGVMYVALVNEGTRPIEVTALRLRDPRFHLVPTDAKSTPPSSSPPRWPAPLRGR